tara:strand:- start:770 stop:1159 length:390 start_codon:yes stop_codon:yes gene_type:complete
MNTNQMMGYINSSNTSSNYWNPISLASTINRTPSYESLSTEDKLKRRLDTMENAVEECKNILEIHNKNIYYFNKRIDEICLNKEEYMKDFYDESPDYYTNNMIDALIWLSYSDSEKKKILDDELDDYFR